MRLRHDGSAAQRDCAGAAFAPDCWQGRTLEQELKMQQTPYQIDVLAIEHQARIARAREIRRLSVAFGAWLGRVFGRRSDARTA